MLNAVEAEVVGLFTQIARMVGLPRSYGQIYGLLFISERPLSMDHLIERLDISKGSASQGLKFLRQAGALQMVYVENDRRLHYQPVAELRNLVSRFLQDKVMPNLDSTIEELDGIAEKLKDVPPEQRAHLKKRLALLQSWEKRTRRFLPAVIKLVGT